MFEHRVPIDLDIASGFRDDPLKVPAFDVRRLWVLRQVARRGSLAAAGRDLGYTRSAVSQQIAALERETGVALVERRPNALRLTDAGVALARQANVILHQLLVAEAELRTIGGLEAGHLRFGSFATAARTVSAEAIGALAQRHPGLELSLLEADPEDSLPKLEDGGLDLALTYRYDHFPTRRNDAVEHVDLLDDPMRVVLPQGHRHAARPVVELSDLSEDSWIAEPRSDCFMFTALACRAAGFEPSIGRMSSDYDVTQRLVAAGLGVALVPDLALATLHPGCVVRPIVGTRPARRVYATHRAHGARVPAVRAMLRELRATCKDRPCHVTMP